MFAQIKQNHPFNLKKILFIGAIILALAILVPRLALAAPLPVTSNSTSFQDAARSIMNMLSIVQQFLISILWPILLMIGSLLQNDLLYGGPMEDKLLQIWTSMRDLVNIFFVLVLVGVAFYNVVSGGQGENYKLKTILPKFVVWLIAVNFSYLGIKIALDVVNVVSTGIFALPNQVEQTLAIEKDKGAGFCTGLYGTGETYQTNVQTAINNENENKGFAFCNTDGTLNMKSPKVISFFSTFNSRNAGLAIALSLQKIDRLNKVNVPPDAGNMSLVINFMFSVTLYIIYVTAFVALFAVLLVRLVALWLLIVLSPLIALKSVLPESIAGDIGGGDVSAKFIKTAIIPIPIALVLSVGFILLSALDKATFNDGTLGLETFNINLLTSGISTLQELIVSLGTVGFLWVGIFEAMKGTYADSIVDKVKGFAEGLGGLAGKLPGMIPLFPTAGGKASLSELSLLPSALNNKLDDITRKGFETHLGLGGGGADQFGEKIKNFHSFSELKKPLEEHYSQSETPEFQKHLGEWFGHNQSQYDALKGKPPAGLDRKTLLEGLKLGTLTKSQMDEFYKNNNLNKGITAPVKPPNPSVTGKAAGKPGATPEPAKPITKDSPGLALVKQNHLLEDPDNVTQLLNNQEELAAWGKLDAEQKSALDELRKSLTDEKPNEATIKANITKAKSALEGLSNGSKQRGAFIDDINHTQQDSTTTFDKKVDQISEKIQTAYESLTHAGVAPEVAKEKLRGLASTLNKDMKDGIKEKGGVVATILEKQVEPPKPAPKKPGPAGSKPPTKPPTKSGP